VDDSQILMNPLLSPEAIRRPSGLNATLRKALTLLR